MNKNAIHNDKPFAWDGVVRFTHWAVAAIVFANVFIDEAGEATHRYLGYTALGLVICRLLWSVTAAKSPARLRDLMPTIAGFGEHLSEIKQRHAGNHRGHNAFGLLAVWAMWGCIIALGVTGFLSDTDWGIDNDISDWHEAFATILQAIVVLHIIAVFATSWWLKHNLLKTIKPFIRR